MPHFASRKWKPSFSQMVYLVQGWSWWLIHTLDECKLPPTYRPTTPQYSVVMEASNPEKTWKQITWPDLISRINFLTSEDFTKNITLTVNLYILRPFLSSKRFVFRLPSDSIPSHLQNHGVLRPPGPPGAPVTWPSRRPGAAGGIPGVPGIPPLGGARARPRPRGAFCLGLRQDWLEEVGRRKLSFFFVMVWFCKIRWKGRPCHCKNTGLEMDIDCIIPRSFVCINNVTIRSRWYLGHVKQAFLSLYECKLGVLLKMDQHPFDSWSN